MITIYKIVIIKHFKTFHFFLVEQSSTEPLTPEEIIQAKRQARRKRIPHTRADLLNKIEMLRIAEDDENDEVGDTDEENTDSDEYDFDSDDVESEEEDDDDKDPAKGLPWVPTIKW